MDALTRLAAVVPDVVRGGEIDWDRVVARPELSAGEQAVIRWVRRIRHGDPDVVVLDADTRQLLLAALREAWS